MSNLRLPEGIASVTVDEQSYAADSHGTLRDLDAHIAREIMAHDPRIVEFAAGGPDDPAGMPGANDKRVLFLARAGSMDRTELFAAGRAMRVSMPANLRTDQLREIVLRTAASAPEDDLPLILGGEKKTDGDPSTLTPAELASANRGNDSLGKHGIHTSAGAGGSTFSQASLTPHAAPGALPSPPGLGPVQLTGTQQPPLNQLDTVTGRPSHDAGAAPFPISVPALDPLTNQPFRAGDPRIPETARPPVRTDVDHPLNVGATSLTGGPVGAEDRAAEAQTIRAADAIHAAAQSLTDGEGTQVLTPEQEAERKVAASAAAAKLGGDKAKPGTVGTAGDANHGNDAEGKGKSPAVKN